ncbi:MAG TPA: aldehyde dehydrogenase family protein [Pontibacter sp.]
MRLVSARNGLVAAATRQVSRADYARFVAATGRDAALCRTRISLLRIVKPISWKSPGFEQVASQPVVCVSWADANAYAQWLGRQIFGPVISIYVYDENNFEETLELVNSTSPYALTGAIFSQDRYAIEHATKKLSDAAGNFYINDKPTGAVVGQQPFGGARASGTNDKAGSMLNLLRWVSARSIKETFVPPVDYRYPFLGENK